MAVAASSGPNTWFLETSFEPELDSRPIARQQTFFMRRQIRRRCTWEDDGSGL